MSKKDSKIYNGEGIIYDDAAIKTKENVEAAIALGQIALYIRSYRKKHNLTQVELAEILGVNQVMVSKLERGNYNPTLKQLLKISYKLTRSNKMFFEIIKNVSKSIKEDYTYNSRDIISSKKLPFAKKETKSKSEVKKTANSKTKRTQKRQKVCA
ncbi:MAG: helix-turn-helix transcriptional regulator [Clostridia bacterium]|nr:helix-turn-helix transcriptional regulator [Clostridia bacterium]